METELSPTIIPNPELYSFKNEIIMKSVVLETIKESDTYTETNPRVTDYYESEYPKIIKLNKKYLYFEILNKEPDIIPNIAVTGLANAVKNLRRNNPLEENKELIFFNNRREDYTRADKIILAERMDSGKFGDYRRNYDYADYITTFLDKTEPGPKWSKQERSSHTYRSRRMRAGPIKDLVGALQLRQSAKKGVSRMVRRAKDLMASTQSSKELHRAYTPLIAGMLAEPEMRTEFIEALDTSATLDSDALKSEAIASEGAETDVLVIGTGVQGAIAVAQLRSSLPDGRIIALDKAPRLGGQFRKYGDRPVFFINSRNFRPQSSDAVGLPGKNGNLNSFGEKAPLQLTDFSSETYPTNIELGVATAVNQYLSAETMLGVEVNLDYDVCKLPDGRYGVTAKDAEGQSYCIITKKVIVATGPGERKQQDQKDWGLWTADDVLSHFADESNAFPMDEFVGKTIAIKGGGDTGRIIAELLTRLGPKEAYGKSTVQFGGPKKILWYGTDFENRDEFCKKGRARYNRLASFIVRSRRDVPQDSQIVPYREKIVAVTDFRGTYLDQEGFKKNDKLLVRTGRGQDQADIVIDATQLTSAVLDAFKNIPGTPTLIEEVIPDLEYIPAAIGRQLDDGIYFIGPVANLPLTGYEQRTFAIGIKENTIAIWKNQIRTTLLAKRVAKALEKLAA